MIWRTIDHGAEINFYILLIHLNKNCLLSVLLSDKAYELHLEHFHSKKHVCSNCGEAFDVLKVITIFVIIMVLYSSKVYLILIWKKKILRTQGIRHLTKRYRTRDF